MKRVFVLLALAAVALAQTPPSPRRAKLVQCWYRDLLGRPAGEGEVAHWAGLLAQQPLVPIASAFVRVAEGQGLAYRELAKRAYGAVTEAEVAEFAAGWQKRWAVRHEARFRLITKPVPKDTPALRVAAAHQMVLGRAPTKVELEGWSLAVAKGFLPHAICHQLEKSDEGLAARIAAVWRMTLKREPQPPEYAAMFDGLRKGLVDEDLIAQALTSKEYEVRNGIPAE